MLTLIRSIKKNMAVVQMHHGGNSGRRKRTAVVIQNPNYRISNLFSRREHDTSCYNNNFASCWGESSKLTMKR